ncbi:MAG: alpha/beta fold hydrolase [Methylophilaceae bacterium]
MKLRSFFVFFALSPTLSRQRERGLNDSPRPLAGEGLGERVLFRGCTFLIFLLLASCANVAPEQRQATATALTAAQGWQKLRLPTDNFILTAYVPNSIPTSDTLTIYIEGDGLAWLTSSIASDDPSPRKPVGLELALRHPNQSVAYLARPCQYTGVNDWRNCQQSYWTGKRFAPEVIASSNQAIEVLKQRFEAKKLVLIGYSGGGAVAALVAARRHDVVRLVTVAGNLDHRAWTAKHRILPLSGSLNAADEWESLQNIPQLHLVGANDKNISAEFAESYAERFPPSRRPVIRVVPDADHGCCWVRNWPELLQ